MQKTGMLRFITAIIILTLLAALALVPAPAYELVSAFLPVLTVTVFASMLLGWFYGLLLGVLAPLLLSLILNGQILFPDTAVETAVIAASALTAGLVYRALKTSVGACISALIAGRAVLSVLRILVSYFGGVSYTSNDFFAEGVMDVLPGLLLLLVLPPLLMAIANKTGLSEQLQPAPKEQYS